MPDPLRRDAVLLLGGSGVLASGLASRGGTSPGIASASALAGLVIPAMAIRSVARRPQGLYGPADRLSLLRAVLAGGVTTLGVRAVSPSGDVRGVAIATLATGALVLDGVDGMVARRTGTASSAGARLDMEVDAALGAVLVVPVARVVGWWVLPLGYLRYAFALAARFRPSLRHPLSPSRRRQTVGVAQGIALAGALLPVLPFRFRKALVAAMSVAVLLSFARDIAMLEAVTRRRS